MRTLIYSIALVNVIFASDFIKAEVGSSYFYNYTKGDSSAFVDSLASIKNLDSIDIYGSKVKLYNVIGVDRKHGDFIKSQFGYAVNSLNKMSENYSTSYLDKIFWDPQVDRLKGMISNSKTIGDVGTIYALHDEIGDVSISKNNTNNVFMVQNSSNKYNTKPPYFRMEGIPGLGIVQMRYMQNSSDTTQWRNPCTDMAYRAELQAKSDVALMPCTLDTLPASKENPLHQSYYLRYIISPVGDTTFDYNRDIIKYTPNLKPIAKPDDKSMDRFAGQWPIPSGFEVKSVERILANGSSEILNYNVQNRVLYLEQVKNRNAVEWVRIVPKNGAVRTLRWE